MLRTPLGRLRLVGIPEGVSALVLFLVAMPLKHAAGMPMAVTVVGSIHGGLFVLFCLALAHAWAARAVDARWAALLLLAAIVPGGTLVADRRLARMQRPDAGDLAIAATT